MNGTRMTRIERIFADLKLKKSAFISNIRVIRVLLAQNFHKKDALMQTKDASMQTKDALIQTKDASMQTKDASMQIKSSYFYTNFKIL